MSRGTAHLTPIGLGCMLLLFRIAYWPSPVDICEVGVMAFAFMMALWQMDEANQLEVVKEQLETAISDFERLEE